MYTQFVCVLYVCTSPVCVGGSPLDLSVSAQRPVCVGSKHIGIMGDEVKGQGQKHTNSVYCDCARVSVCIGGLMKRSRQGEHCARIIRRVMEGVHEEFRLAPRENK